MTAEDVKYSGLGVEVNIVAVDQHGGDWAFDVSGAFTSNRAGLKRTDTLWKALGKAVVLHAADDDEFDLPLVLLTTDRPTRGSAGDKALGKVTGTGRDKPILDVIEMMDADGRARLAGYAVEGRPPG